MRLEVLLAWRSKCAASLLAALCLVPSACRSGQAQKVSAAPNGQVSGVSQRLGGVAIARAPGGEHAGSGSFAVSEGTARVVSGKVAGYGMRTPLGRGEAAYAGGAGSSFDANLDFPVTDFVGTMPRPLFAPASSPSASSAYGIHLSPLPSSGTKKDFTISHRKVPATSPKMKDPEAILHPFTHPIGIGNSLGTGLGSASGASH